MSQNFPTIYIYYLSYVICIGFSQNVANLLFSLDYWSITVNVYRLKQKSSFTSKAKKLYLKIVQLCHPTLRKKAATID